MCWTVLYEEARDIDPGELEELKKREEELKMEEGEMKKLYNYILEVCMIFSTLFLSRIVNTSHVRNPAYTYFETNGHKRVYFKKIS